MADLRKENGHEDPWTIDYFGVGNANWGCGGNMRPEHYADEYRRYQTYVRNYAGNQPILSFAYLTYFRFGFRHSVFLYSC